MIAVLTTVLVGAAAAAVRYLISRALFRSHFLWAVLVVNVVGSAIGGAALGLAIRGDIGSDIRLVLLTGLCGGLTTFSTFSVETIQLVLEGRVRAAAVSVAGNLVLGIGAAAVACCVVLLAP